MTPAEWIALAGVVVSAVGLFFIWLQVRDMNASNELDKAMAVVTLEQAIADARARFAEIAHKIASTETTNNGDTLLFNERLEQYLNFLDRLCSYIRRGIVTEATYRQDYRPMLAETVKGYANRFGADTRHRNILYVHERWSEDKSAIDGAKK